MKTKPFLIGKIIMALIVVMISLSVSVGGALAADAPKYDTGCTGDDKTCICQTKDTTCGQDIVFKSCDTQKGYLKTNCIKDNNLFTKYVNPAIRALTIMVGLAVAIGIIVGGITYGMSGGDPQKAAQGKQYIRNAIIALVAYFVFIRRTAIPHPWKYFYYIK